VERDATTCDSRKGPSGDNPFGSLEGPGTTRKLKIQTGTFLFVRPSSWSYTDKGYVAERRRVDFAV